MKTLTYTKLNRSPLIAAANRLSAIGYLARATTNLIYLKITDAYIDTLFAFLDDLRLVKPDYFGEGGVGAHISVIYPEEETLFNDRDLGQEHFFAIKDIVTAELDDTQYVVLRVKAPTLNALRKSYGLSLQPCFKNHWVDFHITIGKMRVEP